MALRWADVDLANAVIRVARAYDEKSTSRSSRKAGPAAELLIVGALRDTLVEHKANQDRADGVVFGGETPFQRSNLWRRAQRAWRLAGVEPTGLHEARQTFASVLIAAASMRRRLRRTWGTDPSRRRTTSTAKLMPGCESEAAALVDAYLARSDIHGSRLDSLGEAASLNGQGDAVEATSRRFDFIPAQGRAHDRSRRPRAATLGRG